MRFFKLAFIRFRPPLICPPLIRRALIIIVVTALFPASSWAAADVALTVSNIDHTIIIDDYSDSSSGLPKSVTLELANDTKDIQALRIVRNNTSYVVGLIWEADNDLQLRLYSTKGKQLAKRTVFQANYSSGQDFSIVRLAATTFQNLPAVQVRAVKLTYAQPITLERKRFRLRPANNKPITLLQTSSRAIFAPSLAGLDNESAGHELYNYQRLATGVLPIKRDAELDDRCAKHVEYMRLNDVLTHYEEAGLPGYTAEGATGGMESDLAANFNTSMPATIWLWITAIYHRLPMFSPAMHHYGWAVANTTSASGYYYSCLNVYGGADTYQLSGDQTNTTYYDVNNYEPIPYPGVNQKLIPTTFSSGETPDPLTAFGGSWPAGQPISLSFSSADTIEQMAMTVSDEHGQAVAGYFRAPNDSADPNSIYQLNAITFIPKSPLASKTTYQVKVTGQRNDRDYQKEWQFRTE